MSQYPGRFQARSYKLNAIDSKENSLIKVEIVTKMGLL